MQSLPWNLYQAWSTPLWSMILGALPYGIVAGCLYWASRRLTVRRFKLLIASSPLLFAVFAGVMAVVVALNFAGGRLSNFELDAFLLVWGGLSAAGLVVGYPYVILMLGSNEILKRLGKVEPAP